VTVAVETILARRCGARDGRPAAPAYICLSLRCQPAAPPGGSLADLGRERRAPGCLTPVAAASGRADLAPCRACPTARSADVRWGAPDAREQRERLRRSRLPAEIARATGWCGPLRAHARPPAHLARAPAACWARRVCTLPAVTRRGLIRTARRTSTTALETVRDASPAPPYVDAHVSTDPGPPATCVSDWSGDAEGRDARSARATNSAR
jgi:hypothetical protein